MPTIQKTARGTLAALAALGVIAALAACGASPRAEASGELKSGNEQAAFDDWQRDFSACMSDEGVEMGGMVSATVDGAVGGLDESSETSGSTLSLGEGEIDFEVFEAAQKACTDKLGEMPTPPGMPSQAEMQEGMLAFAKCMREAGYDYPDPESSSGGGITVRAMPAEEYDPAVMDACGEDAGFGGLKMRSSVAVGGAE